MKTEQLKEWGLDERQIGMVMRENGRDIEAVKAKFAGYDALKQRAAQLEKTAASSEEVQQLRQQVRQWREKAEETEKSWKQRWEKRDFEDELRRSLHQAGARSEKAVRALLQEQELSLREDGTLNGLKEQLENIRCECGYLFGPDQAPPVSSVLEAGRAAKRMTDRCEESWVCRLLQQERMICNGKHIGKI